MVVKINRRGFLKAVAASSAAAVIPAIGLTSSTIKNFKYTEQHDLGSFAMRCMITFECNGKIYHYGELIDESFINNKADRFEFVSKNWAKHWQNVTT